LTYYQDDPLMLVEGKMQYVWDETGKQYLDAVGGIVTTSVGHCHPEVVERVEGQLKTLQHATTIYLHPTVAQYGKCLADHFPSGSDLKVSYFVNSGSEANDLAILTARQCTGRFDVVALRHAYHGGSPGAMAVTAHSTWKYTTPHSFGVHHGMPGYCFRCPLGLNYPDCEVKCARDIGELIKFATPGQVACFIAEPIMGVGGFVTPPPEYFQIAYEEVRKAGGLCIADEVQTGFGRTGTKFWGFENWNVVPDLVTMAKGIGNGTALGAVTTRPEVAQAMTSRIHFNTFGGNPVQMSQAQAVMDVIDGEGIQENSRVVGGHIRSRLLELQEKHPIVGEVRGMGLLLGMELVRDRVTKEPADTETVEVLQQTRLRGLLLGKGGFYGNVLRLAPPMCLTLADADFLVDCLDDVFAASRKGRRTDGQCKPFK
jgi:alanine-glyoxylate transaminase/(R)-3-amino-2-methylpropionate-pyruvate transaminase